MKIIGKPINRYGWVRLVAWAVLAGIVVWMLAAAGLRAAGELPWLVWSGSREFSLLEGLELALIPLLAAILAGWLEALEQHHSAELTHQREAKRVRATQREAAVRRFREAVRSMLPEPEDDPSEIPVEVRTKISQLVREALSELDGRGKGELLHDLFESKLVTGEKPAVDLCGADFGGVNLTNAELPEICLDGVNLTGARMNGAQLGKAHFSGANLGRAFLLQADLRGASLRGSNLREARLDGANLEGADCSPDSLERAILIDTIFLDGRKVTNENGKQYLRDKELSIVVDRL